MLCQELQRAPEESGGGVVASRHHGEGKTQELRQRDLFIARACVDESRDHVVAGLLTAQLDQAVEVAEQLADRVRGQ